MLNRQTVMHRTLAHIALLQVTRKKSSKFVSFRDDLKMEIGIVAFAIVRLNLLQT